MPREGEGWCPSWPMTEPRPWSYADSKHTEVGYHHQLRTAISLFVPTGY